MDPARAAALDVTLGRAVQTQAGDVLPPFYHQAYFWSPAPAEVLGRDGHPRVGGIIPDMGLQRRMWAGGRLTFHSPLRAGIRAKKTTTCETSQRKEGRTGPLGFVTLRHDIEQAGQLCVTEWQDLVYRQDADPTSVKPTAPSAPNDAETEDAVSFSTTQLFRYSAVTFNGHRIHYDLPYARQIEGYEGLVVHGPLLAQLLMLKALRELGPLEAFSFRATSPLMDFERAVLCRRGRDLWVRGPDGRQCMTAQA
ncbi:FAS1-like dehydratase domain-containing protein [Sulfitobacter aestuariivivens]|nr:MaoC family dehydratase N-terminal domain-containing protein [Sulfitobacter aestuariivivens]